MRLHPRTRIGRILFRAPIWLYRWGLGGLLGNRFLLLTHKGRKSGRLYDTVIEVIKHDPATNTYYVVSGFGKRSDWFRNVQKTPEVTITVGRRRMRARARILPPEEAVSILIEFARAHPLEIKILFPLFGYAPIHTEDDMRAFVEAFPVVEFKVQSPISNL